MTHCGYIKLSNSGAELTTPLHFSRYCVQSQNCNLIPYIQYVLAKAVMQSNVNPVLGIQGVLFTLEKPYMALFDIPVSLNLCVPPYVAKGQHSDISSISDISTQNILRKSLSS